MSARFRTILALLCALAAVSLTLGLVSAVGLPLWQEDGVAICAAGDDQQAPQIISDGSGGAIVTWQDEREDSHREIYAQRVYSDGTPAWATDGVSLSAVSHWQHNPQIVSDDSGGAIVTWQAATANLDDIYAQRVDSDGNIQWTLNGVSLCTVSNWQLNPQIASDGSGGAIVTWGDVRSGTNTDIYAQRVDADGKTLWITDGVTICDALNQQSDPQIIPDGSGGAIVTWWDYRGGTYSDIYAQRVYSDGTMAWATDGVSLCVATDYQSIPQIASDGSAGAIVTWLDLRDAITTSRDIYAQRVYSDGTVAWASDGVSLCVESDHQQDPQIVSDGSGGAIVTWEDWRNPNIDIYAQRVYSNGTPAWTTDGVSISVAANNQLDPQITSDGSGGAIVTWKDERGSDSDIYAQRVDADGNVQWEANGVRLGAATDDQVDPQLAPAPNGGAIVTWADYRDSGTSGYDIYAQRVGDLSPGLHLPLALKRYE